MISSMLKYAAGVSLLGSLVALPTPAGAAGQPATPPTRVYLIQGVPGSAVDVKIDGRTIESGVDAKAIVGPVSLTRGKHTITFSTAGWNVSSTVDISRPSSDIVLHWPADIAKKPVVTVFNNDLAAVGTDKGRLTVAHTAVVPPADVRVDEKVLFANIANGEFVTAEVPGGTYSVDVVPTGETKNPLLGPVDLPVKAGVLTRVFAIGQPSNGSMDAVVQVLPLANDGSPAPGKVDAGSAGLVGTPTSAPQDLVDTSTLLIAAGLLIGLGALFIVAGRRRTLR